MTPEEETDRAEVIAMLRRGDSLISISGKITAMIAMHDGIAGQLFASIMYEASGQALKYLDALLKDKP